MIKFGTDGWRAVIAQDFTFDNVKVVAQAIADYLKEEAKGPKRTVIGYDGRFLSQEFAQSVACVFAANGIKAVLSDRIVPTPTVSFHCLYSKYDLGIMITASHNPSIFNGLKIKTKEGAAADKSLTDTIEALLYKHKPGFMESEEAEKKGLLQKEDLTASYVAFLKRYVEVKKIQKLRAKVLVDIMYGSGDRYVEKILGKSNLTIDYLHNEFNPSFGGISPEPIEENLKELIRRVRLGKYDFGIALDGDSDRIAAIDSKGNYINAQVLLPLLAIHMTANRRETGGIGKTVVGSNMIDEVASDLGLACYETPVGFKHLSELFRKNLICIGGEEAGGIGFKGYIPERDGSCAFLLILEMLALNHTDFDTLINKLYKKYGCFYYSRTAIPVKSIKKSITCLKLPTHLLGKKISRVNNMDGIKMLTPDSWLMLRQSGTEPIVRVYAESTSKKEANALMTLGRRLVAGL